MRAGGPYIVCPPVMFGGTNSLEDNPSAPQRLCGSTLHGDRQSVTQSSKSCSSCLKLLRLYVCPSVLNFSVSFHLTQPKSVKTTHSNISVS